MRPCQQCGRSATFKRKLPNKYKGAKRRTPTVSQKDHDLCQRCWRTLMESIRSTENA
jgi:hypothetical protein